MQGDVFDPASWRSQLQGAVGVISTLGGFGSNDAMFKVPSFLRRTTEPSSLKLTRSCTSVRAPGHASPTARPVGAHATAAAAAAGSEVQRETARAVPQGLRSADLATVDRDRGLSTSRTHGRLRERGVWGQSARGV